MIARWGMAEKSVSLDVHDYRWSDELVKASVMKDERAALLARYPEHKGAMVAILDEVKEETLAQLRMLEEGLGLPDHVAEQFIRIGWASGESECP